MLLKRLLFLLFFTSCSPTQDSTITPYIEPSYLYTEYEQLCIDGLNNTRESYGVNSLILHNGLSLLAKGHADYMVLNGDVGHDNFGIRLGDAKAMGFVRLSENIAYGYTNVDSLISAWLKSDEHRDNLLDEGHLYGGFAISIDSDGKYYYVHLFSYM